MPQYLQILLYKNVRPKSYAWTTLPFPFLCKAYPKNFSFPRFHRYLFRHRSMSTGLENVIRSMFAAVDVSPVWFRIVSPPLSPLFPFLALSPFGQWAWKGTRSLRILRFFVQPSQMKSHKGMKASQGWDPTVSPRFLKEVGKTDGQKKQRSRLSLIWVTSLLKPNYQTRPYTRKV